MSSLSPSSSGFANPPSVFPPLPEHPQGLAWHESYLLAQERIQQPYAQAYSIWRLEDPDPLRLNLHKRKLFDDCFPILQAMEGQEEDYSLPVAWFAEAAECLGALISALHASSEASVGM